jgi:hypothetical protein
VRAHLCVNVPKLGGASEHFERRNELTAINARLSAAALRRTWAAQGFGGMEALRCNASNLEPSVES